MRRISKPWPPRDVYRRQDDDAAITLREAEIAFLSALPEQLDRTAFARLEFNRLEKRKVRREMYREQHFLCIYCEREVDENYPLPEIDHWHPLSRDPDLALDWRNLYLSCSSEKTCNSAKGNHALWWKGADPHMPKPVDFSYEDVLGFTSRGEIYVRTDVELSDAERQMLERAIAGRFDEDQDGRSVVNLNDPALVKARAAVVASERTCMERDFRNRHATRREREDRAATYLDQDRRPPFVSIRVAWLRKTLGQGR